MKTTQKLREKDAKETRKRREKDNKITQLGQTQILHTHKFNINLHKFYTNENQIYQKFDRNLTQISPNTNLHRI